jgi:hypothetical protein
MRGGVMRGDGVAALAAIAEPAVRCVTMEGGVS